jgi:putative hydrolase of the HAD superfamily
MKYTTLFFDLDDTLYAGSTGLWPAIRDRMGLYMVERLGMPAEAVPDLRRRYYETYGTTLRGLQRHHRVDPDDYMAYVHDLPLEDYLQPDPDLRRLLESLPQPKWVFTNADSAHARRVLAVLGLPGLFAGIVDVPSLAYACKPEPEAYLGAMRLAGESDPRRCVMLDDSPRNLAPARALGFTTVLVGAQAPHAAASRSVNRLLDLPQALPELWPPGYGRPESPS